MKLFKNIFAIIIVGIGLLYALSYYYNSEQKLTRETKSFSASLNDFDRYNAQLRYNILQSSLFAYDNQDETAKLIRELYESYDKLKAQPILQNKSYTPLTKKVEALQKQIDTTTDNIREFLIINAGIKNSFIFLSRQASRSQEYFKMTNQIHHEINEMMTLFSNARRIHDKSYLDFDNKVLKAHGSLNKKQKEFIATFNLHTHYLIDNFNKFITLTDKILSPDIEKQTKAISQEFTKRSQADMRTLNYFAFTLIAVLLLLIVLIIYLFIRISKENALLRQARSELDYAFTHDKLTDLYSRNALEKAVANSEDALTLILINIDKFKEINDLYGNSFGNKLLIEVSKFIQLQMLEPYHPRYYRLGGDEFAILCQDLDLVHASSIADLISKQISLHRFLLSGIEINLSVSIAVNNRYPLLENADIALKHIKAFPQINYIVFDQKMNLLEKIKNNLEVINVVKNALKDDRVVPFFQPILNIETKKIEKYEALMRVICKSGEIITPDKFLEAAKKTSLYKDLTQVMIEKVIQTAQNKPYRFSINFAMQDIANDELMKVFFTQLELHKGSKFYLDIELLESESLNDIEKIESFIKRVKQYGCRVFIDDFGTGYSNFSYFSELSIDTLKIDGSIVKEIATSSKKLNILQAVRRFSHAITVDTIAEFVESKEIFDIVSASGITYAQGYFIAPPAPDLLDTDDFTL